MSSIIVGTGYRGEWKSHGHRVPKAHILVEGNWQ